MTIEGIAFTSFTKSHVAVLGEYHGKLIRKGFNWYAGIQRAKVGTEILAVHERASAEAGRVPLIVTKTFGTGKVLFMGKRKWSQ